MTSLDELRAGGRLVATGTFDLDPARAREKLARYQLVDPHRYVLQFVQAAQLLGATQIRATIDADEVRMSFDGASPSADDLSEIYLHAFGHRGIQKLAALRHLALGVIAAEAVQPSVIRISGAGGTLTVKGGTEVIDAGATTPRNEVYVRERARLSHVFEFFRTMRGQTAEEVALEDARYATPELLVNRKRRNSPETPPRGAVKINVPHEVGWVAVERGDGLLTLVQHGVAVERVAVSIGELAVVGVIETTRLSTNLSQSAFVRNHMWDALIHTVVMPAALDATEAVLSRQLRGQNRPLLEAMLAEALRCRRDFARRGESTLPFDTLLMRWADIPVWRRLPTQSDGRTRVSTQQLLRTLGEGAVFVSTVVEELDVLRRHGMEVAHVLASRPRDREVLHAELLASSTGRQLVDLTDAVRQIARQRVADQRLVGDLDGLEQRSSGLWLDRTRWGHLELARSADLRIHLGVPNVPIRGTMSVVVVVEDAVRLRTDVSFPVLPGCGLLVAHDAPTDLPSAELIRSATRLLVDATLNLLAVRKIPSTIRINLLHALATGQLVEQVGAAMGWGAASTDELDAINNDIRPDQVLLSGSPSVSARLFEQVGTRQVLSIRSVAENVPIRFVAGASRRRALQIAWEIEVTGEEPPIWLDVRERAVLEWLFGKAALRDVEGELRTAAARIHRGRTGFVEEPVLHGLFVQKRALEGPEMRGEVGLASGTAASSFIELVVLHDGKRLAHRELVCANGQFRAIIDAQSLRPTDDVTDVVEDESFDAICTRIAAVCHEMFEAWCLAQLDRERLDEQVELALWRAVASASAGRNTHRLGWSVFNTTEGVLTARELGERVGRGPVTVAAEPASGFAVLVPVAPTEHLPILAQILPEAEISRGRRAIAVDVTTTVSSSRTNVDNPQDSEPLVAALRKGGFDIDSVELIEGSALEPRLQDRRLTLGERHPLARSSHALTVAAIGVTISRTAEECAGALRILEG